MRRPLFFSHIPKTAGGSVSRSIRSLFAGEKIIDFESSAPLFRVSDGELASASMLTGHAGPNLAHRLSEDTITMTVLRDPVKRVLSTYNFFVANEVLEPGLTDFIVNKFNLWAIDNLMTWMLVHDHTAAGRRDEPWRDWTEDMLLEEAFAVLQKINIIGVADDLGEVLGRLEAVYERKPLPLERVNQVDRHIEAPTEEELEMIRSYNRLDQLVYEEALRVKDDVWERTRESVTALQFTNNFI
ncbi:sulfotransferase family 2 domain-containing protein [Rhizobium sp. TH2]|uniref:sulfotransferase family protein n=1 Tax=Rhizobium sp. TH2 TaxID=2775403 RepID=UPI002157DF82|nr:sulfotransferase family protein [Rhizobium sp. TH2]UVC06996.1 sulfotransferase family 2 domain-containing protein [Rhizobium sp. TH2]